MYKMLYIIELEGLNAAGMFVFKKDTTKDVCQLERSSSLIHFFLLIGTINVLYDKWLSIASTRCLLHALTMVLSLSAMAKCSGLCHDIPFYIHFMSVIRFFSQKIMGCCAPMYLGSSPWTTLRGKVDHSSQIWVVFAKISSANFLIEPNTRELFPLRYKKVNFTQ